MSNQAYGPKIFVGRKEEIAIFRRMLDSSDKVAWVLNLYGSGGIGKTQLLNRFVELVEKRKAKEENLLITKDFIDLYWTENQRVLGILKNIADQLAPHQFKRFYHELDEYNKLLSRRALSEQGFLQEQEERVQAAFYKVYKKLPARKIILIFDTTEQANSATINFWQSFSRLADVGKRTLMVLAGREPISVFPERECKKVALLGLSKEQVHLYFKKVKIELSPDVVEKVAVLSMGKPILIALTVDWLRYGRFPENLKSFTAETFQQAMVERIQQLQFPEDQIILAMAHFYRRFDEQLLSFVLERIFKRSAKDVTKQIESLARYSFVKYRTPVGDKPGSCTLHDEMRSLVIKYIWSDIDPSMEERRAWSKAILEYYAQTIEREKNHSEKLDLSRERLYYWCGVDLEQAFIYSNQLTEVALHTYDYKFISLLNSEFEKRKSDLSPAHQTELMFREAMTQKADKAQQAFEGFADLSEIPLSYQTWLMEFYTDSGKPAKAIDLSTKYDLENRIKAAIGEISSFDQVAQAKRRSLELSLGILYNNLGYAARTEGHYNAAVQYYERALECFMNIEEAHAQIARTSNNLGFILHRLGRDEEALSYCETALNLRQHLPNASEEGLSYNVLGLIYTDKMRVDEAISYFKKAIKAFGEAGSERGKALVYTAYGRLMRQVGWYKEDFAGEPFNPDREEYCQATIFLEGAIEFFRGALDLYNLSEVLNEKATLLRQQHRWKDAIANYEESMTLAKQLNNLYREIDNLQDLGILHEFWGNEIEALRYAQEASMKAWENKSYYLYARSQRTIGNALFNQKKYDECFKSVAEACIYILQPDPNAPGHSSAKKDLVYDKFENWASALILRLPSHEMAKQKCEYLIGRWMKQGQGGKRLSDLYPGFITKMKSLIVHYPLLTKMPKGELM